MKKRFELIKVIQLSILILITAAALYTVFSDHALYQMIGRDPSIRSLSIFLWITLALSFVGILWDLTTHSSFKKDYRELDHIVYNDHVAGIANRFSCDAVIDKYVDRDLPDNIGCVMLDIANLKEINDQHGHSRGNELIQKFSDILATAAPGLCFVGRNGGNKFLAIFEDCTENKINSFLSNVDQLVNARVRENSMLPIVYRTGRAFSREDRDRTIVQLIALADRRLTSNTDEVTGSANRSGCDAMINKYIEHEMPQDLCCIMITLNGIREINDSVGRLAGNTAIRKFSDALRSAAEGIGFVGRNGGLKFMALFEDCTDAKLRSFLDRLESEVCLLNSDETIPAITYTTGIAFHEANAPRNVSELVALADRRSAGRDSE